MAHITIPAGEPRVSYTPVSSSTGPFNVTFPIFAESDLNVMVDGVLLSSGDWTFTSTGTVTGGFQTGYVTLDTATTEEVVLYRDTTRSRTSDYASGPLDMDTLNSDVDRTVARDQELRMLLNRAVRAPLSDPAMDAMPSAAERASKFLAFDSSGDPMASDAGIDLAPLSAFFQTLTDDPDAATFQSSIGGSTLGKALFTAANKAAARTQLQGPLYFADDFGAVGDGVTDDRAAIQNAIDTANAAGGGWVMLSGKTYGLLNELDVKSNVALVGVGSGQYPAGAYVTSANFKATKKTRLLALAGFAAAKPLVKVATQPGQYYVVHGVTVEGIMIDCDNVASFGLRVLSVKKSRFQDILVYRPTSVGVVEDCLISPHSGTAQAGASTTITLQTTASTRDSIYVGQTITTTGGTGSGQTKTITAYNGSTQVATVNSAWSVNPNGTTTYSVTGDAATEGNGATQFNDWRQISVYCGNTGSVTGWLQAGNPTNNVNQSTYDGIHIVAADGNCLVVYNGDTNRWGFLTTYSFGTGHGVYLEGNAKNATEFARNNVFVYLLCGGSGTAGMRVRSGAGANANYNVVLVYQCGNGSSQPIVDAGVYFWFNTDGGSAFSDWLSFTPTVTFTTPGNLSTSYATQTGRYKRSGRTVHYEIWLQFTPTHTTASGDFIIDGLPYASVTGTLNFGGVVHGSNSGFTWTASKTALTAAQITGSTQIKLVGHQSGGNNAFLTTSELTSGSAKIIRISGRYECAA